MANADFVRKPLDARAKHLSSVERPARRHFEHADRVIAHDRKTNQVPQGSWGFGMSAYPKTKLSEGVGGGVGKRVQPSPSRLSTA